MARDARDREGLTQLHINDFPVDIIEKLDEWAVAQRPDLTRRQVVILVLDEWVKQNIDSQKAGTQESEKDRRRRQLDEEYTRKMAELES